MRAVIPALLALTAACDLLEGVGKDGDSGRLPPTTDWQPGPGGWLAATHPCIGNRTDAMWWDDRSTVWVGCGSTTVGYGLYRSTDGGTSWAAVADARLGGFRVSSIQRPQDDLLYVAGIDTTGSDRVVSLDDADAVTSVYQAGTQVWSSFHVGTYRRSRDGVAVAESLTGTGLVWRATDGDAFVDGADWPSDGGSYQILDLEVHEGAFYGVGSTIAVPPHVFAPAGTAPFALEPVQVASWAGELWSVDVDASGVIAGGVNQDADVGAIFVNDGDPTDAAAWRETLIDGLVGTGPSWIRGVCRSGTLLAAVGEYSTLEDPILLVSADAGASWNDWTAELPTGAGSLHQCRLWTDGRLAVSGKDGYLAVWTPGG